MACGMAIFQSPSESCRKIPAIPQKERFLTEFQAPNFEIAEPAKMQFHTVSHSISPLDSLLLLGLSLDCDKPILRKDVGGVAAIVCDTFKKHSATACQGYCYTCLVWGGGSSVGSLSS